MTGLYFRLLLAVIALQVLRLSHSFLAILLFQIVGALFLEKLSCWIAYLLFGNNDEFY